MPAPSGCAAGASFRKADGTWTGDVLAPVIRDLGMVLGMRHDAEAVAMILRAQMGKAGPPMNGKDLHTGDFDWGVLPAAAPLAVGSLSMAGMAMAFSREGSGRVAFSFIGEGGSSLGEWHEAINACAARRLPAVFCLQNNQTALSTPVADNSADTRLRRQSQGLRHSRHHYRRHRSGHRRGGFHLGGRTRASGRRADAHRSDRDADVRSRPPRRHALSRQGSAAVVGLSAPPRDRIRRSRALRVLGQARSDTDVCAPPRD